MADPTVLFARLDRIGQALRDSGRALALIGLGSVGLERGRADAWSDLDFFAIVEPGSKARYIDRLDWLAAAHPLAWHFRNTADGYKALMADGVFCEFAVFEPQELPYVPFAPGRVVWKRDGVDDAIAIPRLAAPPPRTTDETWIVGDALGCLFVGLQRWHRGERLSAARLVQGHALDRLIELDALRSHPAPGDPYSAERVMHQGLDVATPYGQAVFAPSEGTVVFTGTEGGYGKVLVIDHGYGVKTRYGHLSEITVREGERVKRGAKVAAVGNTGRSTGPHLHYEVRVNGIPENPRKFVLE